MGFITRLDLSDDRQVKNSQFVVNTGVDTRTIIQTQTVVAEDNSIELNFGGSKESALGGGISVLSAISELQNAEFKTNSNGDWVTNNNIIPNGLILPYFTPVSSQDKSAVAGGVTRDDNYIYILTQMGWKRTALESF